VRACGDNSPVRLERELGRRPIHFSFPYGDPSSTGPRDFALARLKTAVTTRKGMLFGDHRRYLTALPRVSPYLSGAPFAL
jgi:hypothetical protein